MKPNDRFGNLDGPIRRLPCRRARAAVLRWMSLWCSRGPILTSMLMLIAASLFAQEVPRLDSCVSLAWDYPAEVPIVGFLLQARAEPSTVVQELTFVPSGTLTVRCATVA